MCKRHRFSGLWLFASLSVLVSALPIKANEPSLPKHNAAQITEQKDVVTLREERPVKQGAVTSGKSAFHVILEELLDRLKRSRPRVTNATRGNVCAISPGLLETENRIYSDRPVFMWQGEVDRVKVYDYWTDEIIWQSAVAPGTKVLRYDGKELIPGESYIWSLERENQQVIRRVFEVMSKQERNRLDQQKKSLPDISQYPSVSLADANYFSELNLWTDMLTSLDWEQHQMKESSLLFLHQTLCLDASTSDISES